MCEESRLAGEELTFEQALAIVQQARRIPREKEILSLEKHIPDFSGNADESVLDYLAAVERVLDGQNITDPTEQLNLLVSGLKGKAAQYWR